MNTKLILLFTVFTLVLTLGAGCATKPTTTDDTYGLPYNGAVAPSDPTNETMGEETENEAPLDTWETYENNVYGYSIRHPREYQASGTTGSLILKKEINDSIQILSLTSDNHKQLEQFEFGGDTGWYDWARAGFPEDDSVAESLSYNKHVVTLGDHVFTVVNYDGASSWGGSPFYYLVSESTVFLLIGYHGMNSTINNVLHEEIIGTFSLNTSNSFGK